LQYLNIETAAYDNPGTSLSSQHYVSLTKQVKITSRIKPPQTMSLEKIDNKGSTSYSMPTEELMPQQPQ
jgi:hypothetical protein